jgi:uncharacterized protein YjbJ (UPF0337 family)
LFWGRRRRIELPRLTVWQSFSHHIFEGEQMKQGTKDELEGKLHEAKGKVKEKAGQVINNPDLETDGHAEKVAGKVQKKVGQVEEVLEK